jgi:argininosuccinate synthase
MADKVVLSFSGGLDTSVAIKWLAQTYNLKVIALAVGVGGKDDLQGLKERALSIGAEKAIIIDARQELVNHFIFPSLKANALYEDQYPLATALSRPLIARLLVDTAHHEGAKAVAHGCTAKGNDQVRFDVAIFSLDPDLRIIAPAREWKMNRQETMAYAEEHGIPIAPSFTYSIDENLWGRSVECGALEDPMVEPPEDAFGWTASPTDAPHEPCYVEVEFDQGIPIKIDGQNLDGISMVTELNEVGGKHGVGRIDYIEDRVVGIKSREVYEAPAAVILLAAHRALEGLVLSRDELCFKKIVEERYADLVYSGRWFSALRRELSSFIDSTQEYVTGLVRLKLFKGNLQVVGRESPYSLYRPELATYDKGDVFEHDASEKFIRVFGLIDKTQAKVQRLNE